MPMFSDFLFDPVAIFSVNVTTMFPYEANTLHL